MILPRAILEGLRPPQAVVHPPVQPPAAPQLPPQVLHVAQVLANTHGIDPRLALASAAKAHLQQQYPDHPAFSMAQVQGIADKPPTSGPNSGTAYVKGPYVPPGGMNPYTGKPLGSNEYIGVAGSEMDHPGMTRIPPPGWDNPSSPFYERRNYYTDANGNTVAIEPGFQGGHSPYDTGRAGERNTEAASRPGYTLHNLGEPGVTSWGPGQTEPGYQPWQQPSNMSGLPDWLVNWFKQLAAQNG